MSRPDLEAGQEPPASDHAAQGGSAAVSTPRAAEPGDEGADVEQDAADVEQDAADVEQDAADVEQDAADVEQDAADEDGWDDDVEQDAADEDGWDDDDESDGAGRPWWLYALALASTLLLVAVVLLALQVRADSLDEGAREAALGAARQSALNLTSIDKDNFDADVELVLAGATGEFRQDFQVRSGDLRALLEENQVMAEGQVLEAAVVRADRQSATVLVVVDSTVSNTAAPEGRVNSYRMRLEVERVGDKWLTSMLEFVG